MKKKLLATLGVAAVAGLALASCNNSSSGPSEAKELKMNLAYGDAKKTLTYGMSSPITMPDGTVVSSGDLKPMWQYVEKQLNIDITDVVKLCNKIFGKYRFFYSTCEYKISWKLRRWTCGT